MGATVSISLRHDSSRVGLISSDYMKLAVVPRHGRGVAIEFLRQGLEAVKDPSGLVVVRKRVEEVAPTREANSSTPVSAIGLPRLWIANGDKEKVATSDWQFRMKAWADHHIDIQFMNRVGLGPEITVSAQGGAPVGGGNKTRQLMLMATFGGGNNVRLHFTEATVTHVG